MSPRSPACAGPHLDSRLMADQLALEVDPTCAVQIVERSGGEMRTLRVGPLAERDARTLATFLLNRKETPPADGPWRCAVAGGVRVVSLERMD
jgi:hypothetical protein